MLLLKLFALVSLLALARAVPLFSSGNVAIANRSPKLLSEVRSLSTRNGAGSFVSGSGLAFYNSKFGDGQAGYSDPSIYQCFSGPASNFPPISQWMDFNNMFSRNQQYSLAVVGDSGPEQGAMYNAIVQVSQDSKVDARLILATIIQESTGNVRSGCTNNGVENCGLMQSYNPSDTSYDPNNMQISITQMVIDGTQGTAAGPGLVQLFNDASTAGNAYEVARAYNSGCVDRNNLSDGISSTASYVSDVANRLLGWNGYGGGAGNCGFSNSGGCN